MALESELRSAWIKAGVKLSLGFCVIAAAVGIRIVTATPVGLEQKIEALERGELATPPAAASSLDRDQSPAFPTASGPESRGDSTGSEEPIEVETSSSRDGDAMVSCRLPGGTHFTTVDHCAARGGRWRLVEIDR